MVKPSLQRRPVPAVLDTSKPPAGGPAALPSSARAEPPVESTTPAPTPSASRPVIKLKVNAQSTATSSQSEAAGSIPAPKAKNRKSRTADAPFLDAIVASLEPPPPYIDDGSHDILQEVIAIEREKKQRSMATKDREKPSANGATGKRKKSDSTFDEDDILALATPSKKERVSPPGPTPTSIPNQSSKSKKLSVSVTPVNEKKCRDLLKIIQKIPDTAIFLRPVDPVLDGCPTWVILVVIQ